MQQTKTLSFTLAPGHRSTTSYSQLFTPEDVPTVGAMCEAQGWHRAPAVGMLEYSRYTCEEGRYERPPLMILFHSGLLITMQPYGRRGEL
jgi:hypothetical protein